MKTSRFPEWMKRKVPASYNIAATEEIVKGLGLNTVCESAICPNRGECFSKKTATFMILGNQCTRNCRFCAVLSAPPQPVDLDEPKKIVEAVKRLGLRHVVITSVTRDDLDDGGSAHFAEVVHRLKKENEKIIVEVLTPDFKGNEQAILQVIKSGPDIYNHNLETVPALYSSVRPEADYERSLWLLAYVKKNAASIYTKSGIMLGLGETCPQVETLLKDLKRVQCDIVTIGQYLSPSTDHLPVTEYVHPDQFEKYRVTAQELGFMHVSASPYVRSSFNAVDFSDRIMNKK